MRTMGMVNKRRQLTAGASGLALTLLGAPLAQAQNNCAGVLTNAVCRVTVDGESGPLVGVNGQILLVENAGQVNGDPAISMGNSLGLIIFNDSDGVIDGNIVRNIPNNSFTNFTVNNSGRINGDVVFNEVPSFNLFINPYIRYIAEGGTVTGDVQLGASGFSTALFLQRGADDNVAGTISAGLGLDIYVKQYETSQNITLGQYDLPASFEIEGYGPVGADTVLTLNGTGTTISLLGDGQVINQATINGVDATAHFPDDVPVVPPSIGYQSTQIALYQRQSVPVGSNGSYYSLGYGGALTSFTNEGILNADVRLSAKAFTNSGAINLLTKAPSSVVHAGANSDFLFDNSGTIVMTYNGSRLITTTPEAEFDPALDAAFRLRSALDSSEAHDVTLSNSGTIIGGLDVRMIADQFSLTNSGTLVGLVEGDFDVPSLRVEVGELYLSLPTAATDEFNGQKATFTNTNDGVITHGAALDLAAFDVDIRNQGVMTGVAAFDHVALKAEQDMLQADDEANYDADSFSFNNSGTINGSAFFEPEAAVATFVNSGNVVRSVRDPALGVQVEGAEYAAFDIVSETVSGQILSFTNSGVIESQDRASSGLAIEVEAGIDGSDESDGPMTIASAAVTVINSGTIRASGGATQYASLSASANQQIINATAALAVDVSDVTGASSIIIRNQSLGLIEVSGQMAQVLTDNYASLGAGFEQFGQVAIIGQARTIRIENDGVIRGGAGSTLAATDQFTPDILRGRYLAGAIHLLGVENETAVYTGSVDHVINRADGEIYGSIDLGDNDDKLENYGLIAGDIFMGAGNDTLTHSLLAQFSGIADGGAGNDTLFFDISGTSHYGAVDAALNDKFINFEIRQIIGTANIIVEEDEPIVVGPGTTTFDENLTIEGAAGQSVIVLADNSGPVVVNATVTGNIEIQGSGSNQLSIGESAIITGNIVGGAGSYTLGNNGAINGGVLLGDGNNSFSNSGVIADGVTFGSGDDQLILSGDWSIGGDVVGGAGDDAVAISFSTVPVAEADVPVVDLSGFTGFETLAIEGGMGKVSDASFDQIEINGGRLIGAKGGTIAGDVTIGAGGTFGSAGDVVGDITVKSGGVFSPGASPEEQNNVGDTTMEAGSTLVFEFVPAPGQSDQINQAGKYHIEAGALLDIRGERPLTPGVTYNMISAEEMTGAQFTIVAWDRSAVQGFLRYTPTSLQLVGSFALSAASTAQVMSSLDYVNGLLIDDAASSDLIDAIPDLLGDNGFANAAVFASLTPEAYASAAQLGVDHGLSIISASRTHRTYKRGGDGGLFSYAQFVGDWSKLKAGSNGASRVKANSYGVVGGLGYGNETASISAFIGYLDSKQRIDALDAQAKADGLFIGAQAQYQSEMVEISAMVAHDWSNVNSARRVLDDELTGKYNLNTLILDANVGVKLPVSEGWAIGPRAGLSHISTKRGAALEQGSAAFALDVAAQRHKATFVDAAIRLEGGQGQGAAVEPWLEAGLRHQLNGRASAATAGFINSPSSLTVAGAARKETLWTAAVGLKAALSQSADLYGSYNGEFGNGGHNRLNIGIRYRF